MNMHEYYTKNELQDMGFRALGDHVLISRDARIYSPKTISIGDDVLIDAFTLMNGDITIGNRVHIGSHCELFAGKQSYISFGDHSGLSSHVSVYGRTDDYVGPYLFNPTVPAKYKNHIDKPVILENCVLIGTHSVVLPGVRLGKGCSFGANSLINRSTEPGGVYVGSPCRRIRERDLEEILRLEEELSARDRERKEQRTKKDESIE